MKASVDPLTVPDSGPPGETDPKNPQSSASKPELTPKAGAAEDQSRQVETQTSPSERGAAIPKAPEIITTGGLTSDEARRRLAISGPNSMPDTSAHPIRMALEKCWAPVPWMLEAAIVVELALGKYVEAGVIAFLLVFNAALGLFQERPRPGDA